jgi:hypothetical protein
MKSRKTGLFLALSLILAGTLAFAQDVPKPEESPMKISGQNFTSINMGTGAIPKNTMAMNLLPMVNFNIERIYLKWDHELGKIFSYHVIFDVSPDVFTSSTAAITGGTATNSYVPFIKNAYIRTKGGFDDFLNFKFDIGILNTPIILNRNKMADTRWFESVMHSGGQSKVIGMIYSDLGQATKSVSKGIDESLGDYDKAADLGLSLEIQVLRMFTLTAAATVGEGWTNISKDFQPNYAGKAWYGDLFIEPLKGLYIHAFMRFENVQFLNAWDQTSPTEFGKDAWFSGGGIGINMLGIRVGADFELGQNITKYTTARGGDKAKNFFEFNAWLNWNMNEIAGFPMLIVGRFSYGMFNDARAAYAGGTGVVYDTVYWNAGLGWQLNKNIRIILLFEMYTYSDAEIYMAMGYNPYNTDAMAQAKATNIDNGGWNNSASSIKLATEVKF